VVKGRHGPAVETGGAELQKMEMSGPSSLEPSLVSSVLRLILMDRHPPSSCPTPGLDEGCVIRGDRIGGPIVGYRVGRMKTSPSFSRVNLFSGLTPRRWLYVHK